eukprot:COSAG01_NODE_20302_length_960_cov_8.631823_1_plen_83_part_00
MNQRCIRSYRTLITQLRVFVSDVQSSVPRYRLQLYYRASQQPSSSQGSMSFFVLTLRLLRGTQGRDEEEPARAAGSSAGVER